MQKEGFYIDQWRKLAERSLGWGDSAAWSDIDFEQLAGLFFEKTNTMLSITTLKRLWGRVKYDSSPNAATLNALAKFIEFDDWRAFKQSIDAGLERPAPTKVAAVKKKKNYLPFALIAAFIAGVLAVLISWNANPKTAKITDNTVVKFEAKEVTDDLPNSVVFNYDASGLNTDSVTLQQTWDPSRTERIAAKGKQHTSIYYYPGYFTAKLIANGQVKKETPVFIKTRGWVGLIEKSPVPTYLANSEIRLPGGLGVTAQTLAKKTGLPVLNNQVVSFYNVRKFEGLDGGDFVLETTLRNTSKREESSCRKVVLYILGTRNAIVIPLADSGCTAALSLFTSSKWIDGKNTDLSAFGCDFNNFQNLRCRVKDKQLRVDLNGKQILDAPVKQTIDHIIGVCISFEGAGEIKNIKMGDGDKVMLDEDFGRARK